MYISFHGRTIGIGERGRTRTLVSLSINSGNSFINHREVNSPPLIAHDFIEISTDNGGRKNAEKMRERYRPNDLL